MSEFRNQIPVALFKVKNEIDYQSNRLKSLKNRIENISYGCPLSELQEDYDYTLKELTKLYAVQEYLESKIK